MNLREAEEFDFEKVDLDMFVMDSELLELPNRLQVEVVCQSQGQQRRFI
jgi:hypothetical protein